MSDTYYYRVSYTFQPLNNSYVRIGYYLWDSFKLIKKHLTNYTLTEPITNNYSIKLPEQGVYHVSPVINDTILSLEKLIYNDEGVTVEPVHSPDPYTQFENERSRKLRSYINSSLFNEPKFKTALTSIEDNRITNPNQYSIADQLETVVNSNLVESPSGIPGVVRANDFSAPIYNTVFRLYFPPDLFSLTYEDYNYDVHLIKVERSGINSLKVYSYWEVTTIDSYYSQLTHFPSSFDHLIEVSNDRGFSKELLLNSNVNKIHRVHNFNHLPYGNYKVRIKLKTGNTIRVSRHSRVISLFSDTQELLSYEN